MSKNETLQNPNTHPLEKSTSERDIAFLINELGDPNGSKRQHAREALIAIGTPAVHDLIVALSNPNDQVRWEAAKSLYDIRDIAAAPALVELLEDENIGVRWAASEALIDLGQAAVPPILEALWKRFDSVWLREGAHHVLHVLK